MSIFFSKMIGTLAVIMVIAAFIGGSDLVSKFFDTEERWKYIFLAGVLGGAFGIYGTISGVTMSSSGAVISVRDIGPMLAGFMGGPMGGLLGGLICGLQRYTMGGITALACVIATCTIGTICGLISKKFHSVIRRFHGSAARFFSCILIKHNTAPPSRSWISGTCTISINCYFFHFNSTFTANYETISSTEFNGIAFLTYFLIVSLKHVH